MVSAADYLFLMFHGFMLCKGFKVIYLTDIFYFPADLFKVNSSQQSTEEQCVKSVPN